MNRLRKEKAKEETENRALTNESNKGASKMMKREALREEGD